MKHIFYIHSPITSRLCMEVVKSKGLAKEDILWLTARDEYAPDSGLTYCIEDCLSYLPTKGINFVRCRMQLKKWKLKFGRLVCAREGFICYIPQTRQLIFQLIVTHSKCNGYYLVEEGMAAYSCPGNSGKSTYTCFLSLKLALRKIYHFLNYGKHYRKYRPIQDCHDRRYLGCFTWNKRAFQNFGNRQILRWPFSETSEYPDINALIVLDAVVEAGLVDAGVMSKVLNRLFRELQIRGILNLGVKLHPETIRLEGEVPRWWKDAINGMEHSFSLNWIPRDFAAEELAMRKGLPVFVNLSSVGLYAALMGREVVSIARLIAKYSSAYSDYIDRMPKAWSDSVNYLAI